MRDRARTIVTCRKSLWGIHASLLSAFAVLAFTGCGGGGGGGGGVTPSQPPSSSTSTLPTSSTAVVTAGPASQTATLTPIAGGYSGKVTIPVATGGNGSSLTFALSSTLPASVAAAPSVTPLVYVVATPSATVSFGSFPGFSFTVPPGTTSSSSTAFYLAYYDPVTKVWQTILGPGVLNGQTVTFSPAGGSGNVMQGGSASVFVLFAAGPAVNITPIQQPTPYPFPITVNPNPIVFTAPNQSIDVTLSQAGYGGLFVTQNCTVYDTSAGSLGIGATSAPCPIQMSNLSNTIYRLTSPSQNAMCTTWGAANGDALYRVGFFGHDPYPPVKNAQEGVLVYTFAKSVCSLQISTITFAPAQASLTVTRDAQSNILYTPTSTIAFTLASPAPSALSLRHGTGECTFAPATAAGLLAVLSTLPSATPGQTTGQFGIVATFNGNFSQVPEHYTGSCSLPIALDDSNGITYGTGSIEVNLSY